MSCAIEMPRLCECGCGTVIPHRRFKLGHHRRGVVRPNLVKVKRYRKLRHPAVEGGSRLLHRVRAERALGHKLPLGAVVHHADGTTDDNAPLVICQDEGYHKLLHRRMRIKAAGGNPNTDKVCCRCRLAKPRSEFGMSVRQPDGLYNACRPCAREAYKNRGVA